MNACNKCPQQKSCEYGLVTYDLIEKRPMALWEKYVSLFPFEIGKRNQEYSNRLSKQRKFTDEDIDWLTTYLEQEKETYNKIRQFGICGAAYARYFRLKDGILNIEIALKNAKQK